jgi:hypothetical protein
MGHYGTPTGHSHAMARSAHAPHGPPVAYKAPNPIEVWHLPEAANQSIPADVRAQFQRDAHGRVLFFTAPPAPPGPLPGDGEDEKKEERGELRHSTAYLAFRARQLREGLLAKRKRESGEAASEGANHVGTSDGDGVAAADAGAQTGELRRVNNGKRARVAVQHEAAAGPNGAPHPPTATTNPHVLLGHALDGVNAALTEGLVTDLRRLYRLEADGDVGEEEWCRTAVARHLESVSATLWSGAAAREEAERREGEVAAARRGGDGGEKLNFAVGAIGYQPPNEALEWRK